MPCDKLSSVHLLVTCCFCAAFNGGRNSALRQNHAEKTQKSQAFLPLSILTAQKAGSTFEFEQFECTVRDCNDAGNRMAILEEMRPARWPGLEEGLCPQSQ
jgi:hypothetical protein